MSTENFQQPDVFRRLTEGELTRINTALSKLVLDGENKFINKLITLFGNGKLQATSEPKLEQVIGETSSTIKFSGSIKLHASVYDSKGKKVIAFDVPVNENEIVVNDEDLTKTVEETNVESVNEGLTVDMIHALPLESDLSLFRLVDEGSKSLKVYHPAIDSGRELATIGKDEYRSITEKEAFFKDILENQVKGSHLENHYELKFTGAFVDPKIETVVEADIQHKDKNGSELNIGDEVKVLLTDHTIENAEVVQLIPNSDVVEVKFLTSGGMVSTDRFYAPQLQLIEKPFVGEEMPMEENPMPQARMADSYAQRQTFNLQKIASYQDKLVNNVVNDLVAYLTDMKYSEVKIKNIDTENLNFSGSDFSGEVKITASLFSSSGLHTVIFPVTVETDIHKFPKKEIVAELVEQSVSVKDELEKQLQAETDRELVKIDAEVTQATQVVETALEDPKIEKVAGESGGTQYVGPMDVIKMEKHLLGLPEDFEIGSKIFADSFVWELVSKSDGQLSKGENDGSLWTFRKVHNPKENPKHSVGI
jgi:hypothetical protein